MIGPLLSFPSAVSPDRVSLAGSGCVKAVRFADGGVLFVVVTSRLGEGKILSDVAKVSVGNQCRFPKIALAFAIFALRQVALALFATKYLPRTRNFEALGDGFPCLCFS